MAIDYSTGQIEEATKWAAVSASADFGHDRVNLPGDV
jgi:hypothetical protein